MDCDFKFIVESVKDFSRSQALSGSYAHFRSGNISEKVQDRDVVTTGH